MRKIFVILTALTLFTACGNNDAKSLVTGGKFPSDNPSDLRNQALDFSGGAVKLVSDSRIERMAATDDFIYYYRVYDVKKQTNAFHKVNRATGKEVYTCTRGHWSENFPTYFRTAGNTILHTLNTIYRLSSTNYSGLYDCYDPQAENAHRPGRLADGQEKISDELYKLKDGEGGLAFLDSLSDAVVGAMFHGKDKVWDFTGDGSQIYVIANNELRILSAVNRELVKTVAIAEPIVEAAYVGFDNEFVYVSVPSLKSDKRNTEFFKFDKGGTLISQQKIESRYLRFIPARNGRIFAIDRRSSWENESGKLTVVDAKGECLKFIDGVMPKVKARGLQQVELRGNDLYLLVNGKYNLPDTAVGSDLWKLNATDEQLDVAFKALECGATGTLNINL